MTKDELSGKVDKMGTSRTTLPRGNVGDWLQGNVTKIAMASYVGPILMNEDYATNDRGAIIRSK